MKRIEVHARDDCTLALALAITRLTLALSRTERVKRQAQAVCTTVQRIAALLVGVSSELLTLEKSHVERSTFACRHYDCINR